MQVNFLTFIYLLNFSHKKFLVKIIFFFIFQSFFYPTRLKIRYLYEIRTLPRNSLLHLTARATTVPGGALATSILTNSRKEPTRLTWEP